MSTAAHESHRIGPRRVGASQGDSTAESKVAPRRNPSEATASIGAQYDSDEVPVLIRLPNLREVAAEEPARRSTRKKKRQRIDRPGGSKRKVSSEGESKVSKGQFGQSTVNNKLVLGGVVGGILLVLILFALNAGGPAPPAEQDGWANEGGEPELLVQEPQISIPTDGEPPSLYPGFAYEAPDAATAQLAGGQLEQAPLGVPYIDESLAVEQPLAIPEPTTRQAVRSWPTEDKMAPAGPATSTLSNPLPAEGLSLEQGGYQYPTTDSSGQVDHRSSMYPSEAPSYRTGMLDPNRPATTRGDFGDSILNGNIELPPTTSTR